MQQVSNLVMSTIAKGGEMRSIHCEKHGKFEMKVFFINGKERIPQCPRCLMDEQRMASEQLTREFDAKRRQSLSKLLGHSGIPPLFIHQGFDTYIADTEAKEAAFNAAKQYAINFDEMRKQGRGLLFIGTTGTGKTHLTTAICKAVIRKGYSACFTTALTMTEIVKESFDPSSIMRPRQVKASFVEPDLLAIDEIGVQHKSHADMVIVTDIVNQRVEQLKPTIFLSNLPPKAGSGDSLISFLGERVMSRIRGVNDLVVCDWEDHRAA